MVNVGNYGRIQMAVNGFNGAWHSLVRVVGITNWRVDRLVFYISNLITVCEFTARTGKTIAKYILFLPVLY
jgi:hypothetical protein